MISNVELVFSLNFDINDFQVLKLLENFCVDNRLND